MQHGNIIKVAQTNTTCKMLRYVTLGDDERFYQAFKRFQYKIFSNVLQSMVDAIHATAL